MVQENDVNSFIWFDFLLPHPQFFSPSISTWTSVLILSYGAEVPPPTQYFNELMTFMLILETHELIK